MGNKGEKGAALVEFAIVLPLLLVLVFGIIEFGVMIYDKAMLTNASREGARAGIVFLPNDAVVPTAEIQQVVNNFCAANLITFDTPTALTVQTVWSTVNTTDQLTVTVLYNYGFLIFPDLLDLLVPGDGAIDDGYQLTATTTMRME